MTEELTQKEAATRLGITSRQVRNLRDHHGLPQIVRRGKPFYPWPEVLHWYIDFKIQEAERRGGPVDYEQARTREMIAKAEMAELDLAERRGQLVTVSYAASQLERALSALRAQLLNLPGLLAPRVQGITDTARIHEVIQEAVDELMRGLQSVGDDEALDDYDDEDLEEDAA